jgi:hypothetical protein
MDAYLANWKTTAAGIAAILGAVADIANQIATGNIDPNHAYLDFTAVVGGIGLIAAHDAKKNLPPTNGA